MSSKKGSRKNGRRVTTVVDTERKLKYDSEAFKRQKKGQKSEQTVRNRAQMSRARCVNDEMDPGTMPADPPSMMTYGKRKRVAPVLTRDEMAREDPDELERLPEADPAEARRLAKRYKAAHGIKNIADHLLPPDRMVTTQKTAASTEPTGVAPGYTFSSQTLDAHERLSQAMHTETDRQRTINTYLSKQRSMKRKRQQKKKQLKRERVEAEKAAQESGNSELVPPAPPASKRDETSVRGRSVFKVPEKYADDPALFGGRPEGNDELAIMESRGTRQMTQTEINAIKPLHSKKTKHKPKNPPDRFIYSTDAPPGCNESVFELAYSASIHNPERLTNEADEIAENGMAVTQSSRGGLDDDSDLIDDETEAVPSLAIETRNLRVVSPRALQPQTMDGHEQRAADAARRYERPSALPHEDLSGLSAADQLKERGMRHDASPFDAHADEAEFAGLPQFDVEDGDLRQPLLRYFQDNFSEKTTDDPVQRMAHQFVFDNQKSLGNLEEVAHIWQSADGDTDRPKLLPSGAKVATKTRKLVMRDIKKKHEVGVQDFNPPRRSVSFPHAKVAYCLDMLAKRDIFFAYDRPASTAGLPTENPVRGVSADAAKDVVMPDRTRPVQQSPSSGDNTQNATRRGRHLLTGSDFGLLHSLAIRILESKLSNDATKVGLNKFVSSYELGTSRLHPLDAPDLPQVSLDYHCKFMAQPDPNDHHQRLCINNESCLCYTARTLGTHINARNNMGFICREFLLPEQLERVQVHGELPKKRRMCIVCYMFHITLMVNKAKDRGIAAVRLLNDHTVTVNCEGGYRREDMLPLRTRRGNVDIATGVAGFFPAYLSLNFERRTRAITHRGVTYSSYYMSYTPSRVGFC